MCKITNLEHKNNNTKTYVTDMFGFVCPNTLVIEDHATFLYGGLEYIYGRLKL